MKHKRFKITETTLFVYKSQKALKGKNETDPTTSMMTMTVTGFVNSDRKN